jgi:hypothetical protein
MRKFENTERGGDGCLLDVVGVDEDLVIAPYKIKFGEGGAAGKVVRVVLYVWDRVPVRDGESVESSVISARSPIAVLLGHPRRVWLSRLSSRRRTRPWPRPSGLGQGDAGSRLHTGRVFFGCGV